MKCAGGSSTFTVVLVCSWEGKCMYKIAGACILEQNKDVTGEVEKFFSVLSSQGSTCNPQGGMTVVCRVVMHNLMGSEFCLSTNMHARF